MPEEPEEGKGDFDVPPSFFPYDSSQDQEFGPLDYGEPVEVKVEAVLAVQAEDKIQTFVLLSDGERKLPIVIGAFEASSINRCLEGREPERPLSHDLLMAVLEKLDANVDRVVVDDFWGGTYYAKVYLLDPEDEEHELDSRPSDAIAVALRAKAPIFVKDGILQSAGQ